MPRPVLGSTTTPVTQAFGDAASAGTAGSIAALADHRHGMPAAPSGGTPSSIAGAAHTGTGGAVGSGTNYARDNHQHPAQVALTAAGAGDLVASLMSSGDATNRVALGLFAPSPGLVLGSGAVGGQDVRLLRTAAGTLRQDAAGSSVTTALLLEATSGQASQLSLAVAGDTVSRTVLRGDATITGILFGAGNAALDVQLSRTAANVLALATGDSFNLVGGGGAYQYAGTQVVGSRKTGWANPTGTATRTTFATSSVTLPLLAERVKALIDDLMTHGLLGA